MKSLQVYKYSAPTRYDQLQCGTIWNNMGEDSKVVRYIQASQDETFPNWQILGDFLEKSLAMDIADKKFIDKCVKSYKEYLINIQDQHDQK